NEVKKLAEAGKELYILELAYLYKKKSNMNEAFKWFLKSANHGGIMGMYKVEEMYRKGIGVEKNLKKAEEWSIKIGWRGLGYNNSL
ncbi:MAG: sel1 repeat family protein, partial [Endozoicomonadaceae bacterium]|nr:sel1 repeat family protein [Endozoicomonadaceae bacterium]